MQHNKVQAVAAPKCSCYSCDNSFHWCAHLRQVAASERCLRVGAADGALKRHLHHRKNIRQGVLHSHIWHQSARA